MNSTFTLRDLNFASRQAVNPHVSANHLKTPFTIPCEEESCVVPTHNVVQQQWGDEYNAFQTQRLSKDTLDAQKLYTLNHPIRKNIVSRQDFAMVNNIPSNTVNLPIYVDSQSPYCGTDVDLATRFQLQHPNDQFQGFTAPATNILSANREVSDYSTPACMMMKQGGNGPQAKKYNNKMFCPQLGPL